MPQPKRKAPAKKAAAKKKPAAKRAAGPKETGTPDPEVTEAMDQIEGSEETTAVPDYQPSHPVLQNAGLDQVAAEEERQAELAAEREMHNARTAGFKF